MTSSEQPNPFAAPQTQATPFNAPLLDAQVDPATAIITEGYVTEEDFLIAQRMQRSGRRMTAIFWTIFLAIGAAVTMRILLQDVVQWTVVIVVLVILGGYILLVRVVFPDAAARRVWRKATSLHAPVRRLITSELVQTITPDSNVIVRWSAFARHRAADRMVLLYSAELPNIFWMFPRDMFRTDEDWQKFLEIARDNLPAG